MKFIGLMDCNNFFVSCERLFRPDLKGKPVAVLSSNDGCVVARSQEVKDLGIPMGIPLFQVKDIVKKHDVTLFSSNFPLYRDISSRVMSVLRKEFETISVYSVDEAFFDMEEDQTIDDIRAIRARIIQKTGIPVSIGLAPTQTMAKIANAQAKKGNGVELFTKEEAKTRYEDLSCGTIWGIGRQMTKRLDSLDIKTVGVMLSKGLSFMRQEFGVHGERIFLELSGIRAEGVDLDFSPNASIMSTRSFNGTHTDKSVILSALGHHIAQVGVKLRERGLMARSLTIICAPSRHGDYALRQGGMGTELEVPTNDTTTLLKCAENMLDTLFEKEVQYKKAGVIVAGLIPAEYASESLFGTDKSSDARKAVYDIVDKINVRFGRDMVRPGVVFNTDTWAPSARLRSSEYTTKWEEIAHVKAV